MEWFQNCIYQGLSSCQLKNAITPISPDSNETTFTKAGGIQARNLLFFEQEERLLFVYAIHIRTNI